MSRAPKSSQKQITFALCSHTSSNHPLPQPPYAKPLPQQQPATDNQRGTNTVGDCGPPSPYAPPFILFAAT